MNPFDMAGLVQKALASDSKRIGTEYLSALAPLERAMVEAWNDCADAKAEYERELESSKRGAALPVAVGIGAEALIMSKLRR